MQIQSSILLLLVGTLIAGSVRGGGEKVTFVPAADVEAAFARGAPLVETEAYKIHASRREAAGQGEVHVRDTDIVYVLQGTATFVTGGSLVDGRVTGAGEIRGSSIDGGDTHWLEPGDLVIVPAGTPHWFKSVEGPFLYYVVKVTGEAP